MMTNFRKTPFVFILGCTSGMLGLFIVLFPRQSYDQHLNHAKQAAGTDRRAQNCPALCFDPYALKGTPVQAYNAELPVYEESCLPLKFSTHHRFPKTALVSHPGSGNTWSRHLIQQISGKSQIGSRSTSSSSS